VPPLEAPPDRYRYDPADPTPAVGGPLFGLWGKRGAVDNRELESRSDVLVYTTLPLEGDVEIIGPVRLQLYVHSSLEHADFFGRLCDVQPSGESLNVCDGLFRLAPSKGEPQADGRLRVEIDMWATAYRFRRGHRIRLQVSGGAHPRWTRNLGTGEPIATATAILASEQSVYHDQEHPSAMVLPVAASTSPL
jgi:putative CocE/NonD family hydrolase